MLFVLSSALYFEDSCRYVNGLVYCMTLTGIINIIQVPVLARLLPSLYGTAGGSFPIPVSSGMQCPRGIKCSPVGGQHLMPLVY